MAKSFRLGSELEKRLEQAAKTMGVPVSAFIRQAVEQKCDVVLGHTLRADLADVIGAVQSQGGRARRSGQAFKKLIKAKK